MCLTDMKAKLKSGAYTTFNSVHSDARLMFDNCKRYNAVGTPHHAEASRLLELAERTFTKHRAAWTLESGTAAPELACIEPVVKPVVAAVASEAVRAPAVQAAPKPHRREPILAPVEILPPRRYAPLASCQVLLTSVQHALVPQSVYGHVTSCLCIPCGRCRASSHLISRHVAHAPRMKRLCIRQQQCFAGSSQDSSTYQVGRTRSGPCSGSHFWRGAVATVRLLLGDILNSTTRVTRSKLNWPLRTVMSPPMPPDHLVGHAQSTDPRGVSPLQPPAEMRALLSV